MIAASPRPEVSRPQVGRAARVAMALLAILAIVATGCTSTTTSTPDPIADPEDPTFETGPNGTYPTVPLTVLDQRLQERVDAAGLSGATLLVEQDRARLHTFTTGTVSPTSTLRLAESGTWLAAATIMSLVDEGLVALDEPVATVLPFMRDGAKSRITLRQLLSQTSALPRTIDCPDPVSCDSAIAAAPLLAEPGTTFAVSLVGYHVAARLAEAVTDQPWSTVVAQRLLDPVQMVATSFTPPSESPPGPEAGLLAADGQTTAEDLGRFLTMILARGETLDRRVLDAASVEEMERDQTPSLDTSREPWVAATGIPTYGLGVWRDRLRGDGTRLASMVSAPNRFGIYPLIDRTRNAWAVVALDDEPDAPFQAVRDSATIAQLMAVAIDTDGRPIRQPGSTIPR